MKQLAAGPASKMSDREPCLVLVIEDHEDTRFLLQDIFQKAGYRVLLAADGTDGLAQVATSPPDLVVLDLGLPDLGGLDVLLRLRSGPGTQRTPVLVFTAQGDGPGVETARESDGVALLIKPASPQRLLDVAEELLGGRSDLGDSSGSWSRRLFDQKPPVDRA